MQNNVICCKCGTHKTVVGKLKSITYFPNKLVYDENGKYVKCDSCYDNLMIVEGKDYIDLLGKTNIVGDNKEFIRNSNQMYIDYKLNEACKKFNEEMSNPFPKENILKTLKSNIDYWRTTEVINSKI